MPATTLLVSERERGVSSEPRVRTARVAMHRGQMGTLAPRLDAVAAHRIDPEHTRAGVLASCDLLRGASD